MDDQSKQPEMNRHFNTETQTNTTQQAPENLRYIRAMICKRRTEEAHAAEAQGGSKQSIEARRRSIDSYSSKEVSSLVR